jgi:hypothetical protein
MAIKHGKSFLEMLHEQGIISKNVRRVIIDASVDEALKLYIEEYGDERMLHLDVMPELEAAVTMVERGHNA